MSEGKPQWEEVNSENEFTLKICDHSFKSKKGLRMHNYRSQKNKLNVNCGTKYLWFFDFFSSEKATITHYAYMIDLNK